jgi:hypothetical protein
MKTQTTSSTLIALLLACLGFFPTAQAVVPAPDGGYAGKNTAEGENALLSLNVNTGTDNTAVGWSSLKSNVQGDFNTAIGSGALFNNTAHRNTAIGGAAMFSNTTGTFNTAIGMLSLFTNNTGSSNTAMGDGALLNNTTGSFNTAIGRVALLSNLTGSGNVATGAQALASNTSGDQNTVYGYQAMLDNTTGEANTAVGFGALGDNNIGINNTANGHSALRSNTTGDWNTAVGRNALRENTTGINNTAIGGAALFSNTGSNNIALGAVAGSGIGSANDVIAIGASGANVTHSCFIGNIREVTTANGNAIPVLIDSAGQLGTASSSRWSKKEIKAMAKTSESILSLEPVTFRYKSDSTATPQFGLIAEEVAKVNPDLVVRDNNREIYTVRYDAVNVMLLNEFLKEHGENKKQKALIAELRKELKALSAQLKAQAVQIQRVSAQLQLAKASPPTVLNNE